MKKLLMFCSLILPLIASAQVYPFTGSSPKLMKPDISKITGDTTWKTSAGRIADQGSFARPNMLECEVMKKRNHLAIFLYLTKNSGKPDLFYIQKGGKATIYFTDHTSLVLQAAVTDTAHFAAFRKNTVLCWGLYNLHPDEVPILQTGAIAAIQIETSDGDFDYPVKKNMSMLIAKQLEIIEDKVISSN